MLMTVCATANGLEAGAAKAEITPPVGTPLNGYGDRLGRSSLAIHDPVWARCLYLNDGETSVFLVTSDLCVINRELRQRVLELAPREVAPEHIILTATHTHSAQGAMMRSLVVRAVSGRFMPEVLERTARGFAEAMRGAYLGRKRASIGYAVGEQHDLSTNRRYDNGPIDPQIGVIRVDDSDGNPMAIIGNLAAHPTTVSDDDKYCVSADYPGFFYTTLEKLTGPGCLAMFMNGAEGNQRPTNPENRPNSWERTESIGRILAERVKAIADTIPCGDHKLHVGYATPELPLTAAPTIAFPSTVVQTLEIGDLLLTFFPGEACVEIGLEMRKRALAHGYRAQFTVGLSNDYLAYFVPAEYYSHLHYESASSFYGPRISDWFYHEFSKLMTRGEPEPDQAPISPAVPEALEGASRVVLDGRPYEIGYQRGAAFQGPITARYRAQIAAPVEAGAFLPSSGVLKAAADYLNVAPLALFTLGIGVRPLLQGISRETFEEIEGMADGAGLPFDAFWLTQCAQILHGQPKIDVFYRAPLCTMFASVGDRAGADDLLVGRNLDWAGDDPPVIVDVRPDTGHRFVQVGFPWNVGVFTGMNDAGLVLCAERMETLGNPPIDGAPIEFILRDLLQTEEEAEKAVAALEADKRMHGYHVLVAGGPKSTAAVVEFGAAPVVRRPVKGFLLGADPDSDQADPASRRRYARVAELLGNEHIIASGKIKNALADTQREQPGTACIWNEQTKYSVVFEPKVKALAAAFPDKTGAPGNYVTVSLKGNAP
jgi:hypothetical protein